MAPLGAACRGWRPNLPARHARLVAPAAGSGASGVPEVGAKPDQRGVAITLHQPQASLLAHGLKRLEGRHWPSDYTGRLWVHAASHVPTPEEVAAAEAHYAELFAAECGEDGGAALALPESYPTGVLLGRVLVAAAVSRRELLARADLPTALRKEAERNESPNFFCCERAERLLTPVPVSGKSRLWKLDVRILPAAEAALVDAAQMPIDFEAMRALPRPPAPDEADADVDALDLRQFEDDEWWTRYDAEEDAARAACVSTTLEKLGWEDLLLEEVSRFAATATGRREVEAMPLPASREDSERALDETAAVADLEGRFGEQLDFGGAQTSEASDALSRAAAGGSLTGDALRAVAGLHAAAQRLRKTVLGDGAVASEERARALAPLHPIVEHLAPHKALERRILECIEEDGKVLDIASDELRGARDRCRVAEGRAQRAVQGYGQVAVYGGRLCAEVPSGGSVPRDALVVGMRPGGVTLIEPRSAVQHNNALAEAKADEESATADALAMLSAMVSAAVDDLNDALSLVTRLDAIACRARYANATAATRPTFVDCDAVGCATAWEGQAAAKASGGGAVAVVELEQLRHPLLMARARREAGDTADAAVEGEQDGAAALRVVPVDVFVSAGTRAVLITGPNTGGKTATMKAVGLAALMARAGLFVPANVAQLPWFDAVLADIGDDQSLSQSLSKFSARMKRTDTILRVATPNSLVLLDEVGSGTSPTEGSALGAAVLRELAADRGDDLGGRSRLVFATTHHGELKALRYESSRFENAAVDFDEERLAPTYRVLWGLPGRSRALNIAERLGLEPRVVELARERLGSAQLGVDALLTELEEARSAGDDDADEARSLLFETRRKKNELEAAKARLVAREREARAASARRVHARVAALLAAAPSSPSVGKQQQPSSKKKAKKAARAAMRTAASAEDADVAGDDASVPAWEPAVGDAVRLKATRTPGVVSSVKGEQVIVKAGRMEFKAVKAELELDPTQGAPPARARRARAQRGASLSLAEEAARLGRRR